MKRSTLLVATIAAMAGLGASGIAVPTRSRPLSDRERFEQSVGDELRRREKRAKFDAACERLARGGNSPAGKAAARRRRQMERGFLNPCNRGNQ